MKGLPCRDVHFYISGPNIDPKITFLVFYESLLMTGCYLGFSEILEMNYFSLSLLCTFHPVMAWYQLARLVWLGSCSLKLVS